MTALWKRSLLMLAGALLTLASLRALAITILAPSTLAMPPASNEERVIMILTGLALIALGVYMFVRGKRIRLPK